MKVEPRNYPLTVALSTTRGLQAAIDAAKHGAQANIVSGIPVQRILYGRRETVSTIVVQHKTTRMAVIQAWYKILPLTLQSVLMSCSKDVGYVLTLDPMKLELYGVDASHVVDYLRMWEVKVSQTPLHLPAEYAAKYPRYAAAYTPQPLVLNCDRLSLELLQRVMRGGIPLDRAEIHRVSQADNGDVYSIFKGNMVEALLKIRAVLPGDDVFCTDSERNVAILGKHDTLRLYHKYLTGDNKAVLIGSVLCSHNSPTVYDFHTAPYVSPFHGLTLEHQKDVLNKACVGRVDERVEESPGAVILLGCAES